MSDDKTNRGGQDRSRIALKEAYELPYWTERFGVSEDELRRAVAVVGDSADAVAAHLNRGAH